MCQYALYRHISRAVGLIALTLLGGLITDFGSAFCFTVSFLFLRERTGGYHAKTEWQCALYSAAMILQRCSLCRFLRRSPTIIGQL